MKNGIRKVAPLVLAIMALAGCSAGTIANGTVLDERFRHDASQEEVVAACADRAEKGLLFDTVTYFADIVVAPIGAALRGTVAQNPATRSQNAICDDL